MLPSLSLSFPFGIGKFSIFFYPLPEFDFEEAEPEGVVWMGVGSKM